ncbi:MAG TPA: hypothetical protein VMX38_07795 [Verrucomicrobiae bacterium]|jgi:uncharacterized membrane protein YhhN|nr:hypothetical protein [Verrucomicrobiae bacterium]
MVIPFLVFIGETLKKVPILRKFIDERFLSHRRRAQRVAGLVGFLVADALYGYRYFVNHVRSWDLLAVILSVVVVYLVLIVRYLIAE